MDQISEKNDIILNSSYSCDEESYIDSENYDSIGITESIEDKEINPYFLF